MVQATSSTGRPSQQRGQIRAGLAVNPPATERPLALIPAPPRVMQPNLRSLSPADSDVGQTVGQHCLGATE